ncbi:hypothetical protein NM22_06155 [Vibrio tubiashii]|nr:hypothetical protein NM22_06155 [Vibrio tubiashii]
MIHEQFLLNANYYIRPAKIEKQTNLHFIPLCSLRDRIVLFKNNKDHKKYMKTMLYHFRYSRYGGDMYHQSKRE